MNHDENRDAYIQLGKLLNQKHSDQLSTQLQVFQNALINFAIEHGDEIKSNSEFKLKFTKICQSINIDPLDLLIYTNSTQKKRSQNFYIGLSVKIIEICQSTRDLNGGLISLKELISIINESEIKIDVDKKDIEKCLGQLNKLGKGFEILNINDKLLLKFTSLDNLSNDQIKIYELCNFMGGVVTYKLLRDNYEWDNIRCKTVIDEMIMNGFLWIDQQGDANEWQYWEPSWISH
ncbi:unnamed protein product [Candida verbasci]|uniref:Vacuolar-sorting protein SNF8 n=1 Tax=Candida verbasci TaxID=1227364 RepID=A0A9W4XBR9_9ASCO|nr:unnamed protein product [Candida verbasci]